MRQCLCVAVLCVLGVYASRAQRFEAPEGEQIVSKEIDRGPFFDRIVTTSGGIYTSSLINGKWDGNYKQWSVPEGRRIVDARFKINPENGYKTSLLYILLDNGEVYHANTGSSIFHAYNDERITVAGSESFKKVVGDDLYVLGSSNLYVTRDNGQSWQIDSVSMTVDSVKFTGVHITDMDMDAQQNLYAAVNKPGTLLIQKPSQKEWTVSNLPAGIGSTSVFVDRKNNIHTGVDGGPNRALAFMSSNGGATWKIDTAEASAFFTVSKWGDDAFGDVFTVSHGGTELSREQNGVWTNLTSNLRSVVDGSDPLNPVRIHDIGGDSVIVAATNYGLYSSSDRGDTWQASNDGIHAERIYNIVGARGEYYASTSLGVFHSYPMGVSWKKVYPITGFESGMKLYPGGNTLRAVRATPPYVWSAVYDSEHDVGWQPDTLGESAIDFGGIMTVDENGTLHGVSSHYGSSWNGYIYEKKLGEAWHADTTGYTPKKYSYGSAIASDGSGYLHVSGVFPGGAKVMRRSISSGAWEPDTLGLSSAVNYFKAFAVHPDGTLYAATSNAIYADPPVKLKFPWYKISLPDLQNLQVGPMVLDSKGVLFVALNNYNGDGIGIYYTSDDGTSWTNAGFDGLGISSMVSDGSAIFAATNNGIYQVAATSATATATVTPSSIAFGDVVVGDSTTQTITITNTGTEALSISSIDVAGDPSFSLGGLIDLILPLDSLKAAVQFKPQSAGPKSATLTLTIAASGSVVTLPISLTGNGAASGVNSGPTSSTLLTNYPNPFSQATTFRFTLPERGHATILVRDVLGQEVVRLVDGVMGAGEQQFTWNTDAVPEGVYFVELTSANITTRRLITLIR
jgi:hypothetical protein